MYEYQAWPGIRPEEIPGVTAQMQTAGWSLEHTHVRNMESIHEIQYDLLWKKPSKDISYGQMLINQAHEKLTEVADKLLASKGLSGIEAAALGRDIKEFQFRGSPEDM